MNGRISREKINHLSKIILKELQEDESVDFLDDLNEIRLAIVKAIEEELKIYEQIDEKARNKILSQKKTVVEGSREWEILYRKYYNEEIQKLGKIWE
ncbi:MAG: DUF507 family protein [Acidobacteriota bacterium]